VKALRYKVLKIKGHITGQLCFTGASMLHPLSECATCEVLRDEVDGLVAAVVPPVIELDNMNSKPTNVQTGSIGCQTGLLN